MLRENTYSAIETRLVLDAVDGVNVPGELVSCLVCRIYQSERRSKIQQ